jgi:hypothetical protein
MSGDTRVRKHDASASRASILFNAPLLIKSIGEGDGSTQMRKLFLDWLENESQPGMQQRGFMLASQVNLKEALPVALKVLEKPGLQSFGKAQVMISLAKLGSKEHIKALEPYLDDKTLITNINFGNGQMSIQIRDVAMGVSVQLAGQKFADYGFDTTRFGGGVPTSYYYYGFPAEADGKESKAREEAHAKWKEWAKKNLDKK